VSPSPPIRVLLVEDNPGDAFLVQELLSEVGGLQLSVNRVERVAEALEQLAQSRFDAVLLDLSLPDARGLEAVHRVRSALPEITIVVLSGLADEQTALQAVREGAQDYLIKGRVDGDVIARALRHGLERSRIQVELETQRRALEAQMSLAVEAAQIGLWEWDLTSAKQRWSDEQTRLLGLEVGSGRSLAAESPELPPPAAVPFETNHRAFLRAVHPDDRKRLMTRVRHVLAEGELYEDEFRVVLPNKQERWLAVRGRVYRNYMGWPVRMAGITLDTTQRRLAEEALRQSEARLREINQAQQRFVSDAAHELRAPLTAIQGNLELLYRYPDMPFQDRMESVSQALKEAQRLGRLVADLLALARGDGGLRLKREMLDLDRVLLEAFEGACHLSHQHHLIHQLEPLRLEGDRDYLKQLALILLDNALKYTPPGGEVQLTLSRQGTCAELRVSDTGNGIAAQDLPHVFERFYRADQSRRRDPGGSGLGLSIAKWIVEQHGGEIRLESELGQGTTAIVRLPLPAAG
jgi:signal transduction histidine kinase/CheY-like chemotaxis protein